MGATHVDLTLINLYNQKRVTVRALVDTGASFMIVTAQIAEALGFDVEELALSRVTVADGRRIPVPRIGPLQITFEDRHCKLEAVVLGDECLMGFIPLEAMDLIVDPIKQRVVGAHEEGPIFRA